MALLDGQYNILSEQDLGAGRNFFEATKRSGERVRILWYELDSLEDELAFEDYRQLLRRLDQQGFAAIHDIVSRPGAHYVVWEHPVQERVKRNRYNKTFASLLEGTGYKLENAHIHLDSMNKPKLYMLELSSNSQTKLATATTSGVKSIDRKTIRKSKRSNQKGLYLFGLPIPPLISWLPGLIMVAISAFLLNYGFGRYVNTQEVLLPQLVGLDIDVAGQEVQSLGLNSQILPVVSDAEENTVVKMEPKERSLLRQGRTVQLMYAVASLERNQVRVPQLVARGISGQEEARLALEEAGLRLGKVVEVYSSMNAGQVIAQSVAANKTVAEGSSLNVILSKGPRPLQTFIPDFKGMTLEEAQPYIALLGLKQETQIDEQVSQDEPAGTILKQYIKANSIVDPETATLRLLVAIDAEAGALRETSIPNFIGILDLNQAFDLAAEYGFEISKVTTLSSSNLNHGVVAQTPLAYEPQSEISDQITLVYNENVEHLRVLQNQALATATIQPSSTQSDTTNATNPNTGNGIRQFFGSFLSQGNTGSEGNSTGAPQPNIPNVANGSNPTPVTILPADASNTTIAPTPSGTTPIPVPDNPIGIPALGNPALNNTALGNTTLDNTALGNTTLDNTALDNTTGANITSSQTSVSDQFSYRWTIPSVVERKLVSIYMTLEDGSGFSVDNRWLEAGTTDVIGSYSYTGYTGRLSFELRDYDTSEVLGQAITYQ